MIHKPALTAVAACAALAAGLATFSASATTSSNHTSFTVSLTVQSDCAISATNLAFGPTGSALATTDVLATSNLTVTCSMGTGYAVNLDPGSTTGSTVLSRLLAGTGSNTHTVQYQLYSDSGRGTVWGDSSGGTPVTGTGTGNAETITVYGKVPAQTIPPADAYSSTETATITF